LDNVGGITQVVKPRAKQGDDIWLLLARCRKLIELGERIRDPAKKAKKKQLPIAWLLFSCGCYRFEE